jgi:hypothetical protein
MKFFPKLFPEPKFKHMPKQMWIHSHGDGNWSGMSHDTKEEALHYAAQHPTPDFTDWWRGHEHSGYHVEEQNDRFPGLVHWGIKPKTAWEIARYRLQYEKEKNQHTDLAPRIYEQWKDHDLKTTIYSPPVEGDHLPRTLIKDRGESKLPDEGTGGERQDTVASNDGDPF